MSLLVLLRPLLRRLETLAVACELAAKGFEKASAEFEQASQVLNSELPTTLDSVERASLEFEELGQSLNGLTGGLKRSKQVPAHRQNGRRSASAGQERNPVEAIQESTANSMRRVAHDVAALTAALTPAMTAWRKRIGFITERFEAASKEGDAAKATALPSRASSSSRTGSGKAIKKAQAPQSWIAEWRQQQRQASAAKGRTPQEIGAVASGLADAAASAADAAQASLSVDGQASEASPEAQRDAKLINRAATAAQALAVDASTMVAEAERNLDALEQAESAVAPVVPQDANGAAASPREEDSEEQSSAEQQHRQALEVEERQRAAQAVFAALSKAEEAASAAAAASGELESALQKAEQQAGGSWWGWDLTASMASPSNTGAKPGAEPQDTDGMAYPSSPFIAATRSLDLDEETADTEKPKSKSVAARAHVSLRKGGYLARQKPSQRRSLARTAHLFLGKKKHL